MKPRLLDLFCGAGGAAMGYHRTGFDVVGVDNKPQPHYPFPYILGDAIKIMDLFLQGVQVKSQGRGFYEWYSLNDFVAIHASPPCQAFSTIAKQNRSIRPDKYCHPDLIKQTRGRLVGSGKPYVIENVKGAPLLNHIQLCGSWFHLDLHRHRLFESNIALFGTPCCHYWQKPRFKTYDKRRGGKLSTVVPVYGHDYQHKMELARVAMGIDWMDDFEMNEAIPPAYTEYIGKYLLQAVKELK